MYVTHHARPEEHPVEIFFETLLVLVCVGVLAFAGLTVKNRTNMPNNRPQADRNIVQIGRGMS